MSMQENSLEQLQRHGAFRLRLHTFAPELEFGADGAVELELLLQRLSVEGTDGGVVAHLLRDQPVPFILSANTSPPVPLILEPPQGLRWLVYVGLP